MTTDRTKHLGFNKLGRGGQASDDEYKFGTVDRDVMDLVGYLGASGHHHTGVPATVNTPVSAPGLALDQTTGSLPAGTRIFYKYSLVDDRGLESVASPEGFVDTPAAVSSPSAPTFAYAATGGVLLPGPYNYVLSAYKGATSLQSLAENVMSALIPGGTSTNTITLTLPTLPTGADGFNIYRRKPGANVYAFLASVNMQVATPPTTYVDTGAVTEDANRTLPSANTTNNQNAITVTVPGATPTVPIGYTWRIYRTFHPGSYGSSLLHLVVEETSEGSGVITPSFQDLGYGTNTGSPQTSTLALDNPSKIDLATEVTGSLPPGNIAFPHVVEFAEAGTLVVKTGTFAWRCPFDAAYIMYVVASLGKGSLASGAADIIDVNKYQTAAATPTWVSIFSENSTLMPKILVGSNASSEKVPVIRNLVKGDKLTIDIDQVGAAATPTDANLLVQIYMYVQDVTATSIEF